MVTISHLATPYQFEDFVNEGDERWNSREGAEITTVVVHHMAMTNFDAVPEVWREREASAHYGIGPKGEIRAYVGEEKRAWHAGNSNSYSIGIESCNITVEPDWKVSDQTVDSIVELIKEINERYGRKMEIIGHKDAPGNATICPGPSLAPRLEEIRKRVNGDSGEPEQDWILEKGTFTLNTPIYLRDAPSTTTGSSIALLKPGNKIKYDAYRTDFNGYVWVRQPRDAGFGYMATGESKEGKRVSYWGTFS